ncbi:MAG: VWA domain-containing protein [Chloroflexi bacterium]|nr:VWA domain-containing protein [Chloroflexota bacterium]
MPSAPTPTLPQRLIAFCRVLREVGVGVTPGRALDAARSLALIQVADRATFRAALRTNLTISVDEYEAFADAFDAFWDSTELPGLLAPKPEMKTMDSLRPHELPLYGLAEIELQGISSEGDARIAGGHRTASDADVLTHKDFAGYTAADIARARRLIRQLVPDLATMPSRRLRPAGSSGRVDIRRTVHEARRYGGEVVELARQERRLHRLRIVALCDVSGSMDLYSNYLLQFLYALQRATAGVRSFVFSTRLHDVSHVLRRKRFDDALAGLAAAVQAWSGGTAIGHCLGEFNERYAKQLLTPRTAVIVMSDGWERGDVGRLAREMAGIHRRAHRVIWLNPLKGHDGYEPLAAGMSAALPYVDHFLAANNLESLERLKRVLQGA